MIKRKGWVEMAVSINRKIIFLVMAAIIVAGSASVLSSCGGGGSNGGKANDHLSILNTESQFPIVNEPITLTIMTLADSDEAANRFVWQKYEEMTGVKINWRILPYSNAYENINLTFASDDLPDIFLKCNIGPPLQARYGEEGYLLNLLEDKLMEKYAPNFWEYMQERPDIKASQTFPGGEIYSIPAAAEDPAARLNVKNFVNTRWMKNVGITSMPKTTDEFYELLKAFKTKDPNGSGNPDKIIPFAISYADLKQYLAGSFGLMNRGVHNTEFDIDKSTGKLRHIPSTNDYRKMVEYIKKLYGEGLIDREMFTTNTYDNATSVNQDVTGVYQRSQLGLITQDAIGDWEGMEPLTGPDGYNMFSGVRSHLHSSGAFVITKNCKYPEAALRWADYFYSDEGCLFYHYGIEGETFVKKPDGSYDWTDNILSQITGSATYDEVVGKYVAYGGGNNPTMMKYPFFSGAEMQPQARTAAQKMWNNIPKEIWGLFNFTREEQLDYDIILQDINAFVNQRSGEFIVGRVELNDDTWNEYLDMIKRMNVDRALEIMADAYRRYEAALK